MFKKSIVASIIGFSFLLLYPFSSIEAQTFFQMDYSQSAQPGAGWEMPRPDDITHDRVFVGSGGPNGENAYDLIQLYTGTNAPGYGGEFYWGWGGYLETQDPPQGARRFYRFKIRFSPDSNLRGIYLDGTDTTITNKVMMIGDGCGRNRCRIILSYRGAANYSQVEHLRIAIDGGIDPAEVGPLNLGQWYDVQIEIDSSTTASSGDGSYKIWVNNNDYNNPSAQMNNIQLNPIFWRSVSLGSYNDNGLAVNGVHRIRLAGFEASTAFSSNWHGSPPPSDTTPPTVSISSPSGTVSGTVTVSASASDNVGVSGVQFRLNGVNLGVEDTTSPYATTWNTTTSANGTHTLTAVARDSAGNTTTSQSVSVTVSNTVTPPPPPPTETAPLSPASLSASPVSTSQVNLTWSDSSQNETGFSIERKTGLSGIYSEVATVSSNTTTYQSTSLTASTQYYFRVRAYNSVGFSSYSPEATAVTANPAPTNTITVGDRVQVSAKVNVRSSPGGRRLGTQPRNAQGTVTEGPTQYQGYPWYRVNYDSGVDGWTRGDLLTKVSSSTAMSETEIRNSIASIYLLIQQLQEQLRKMGN